VPDDLVERYDFDNDGNISIDELGQAGTDFASGKSVS
jgi:Ca2+-binding EF-hand superfamily protein